LSAAPIPQRLLTEFLACMAAADDDDAPDGAWFQMLEDAAGEFMRQHKLRGDTNDAAQQYLKEART
jgi:hypothetical protein